MSPFIYGLPMHEGIIEEMKKTPNSIFGYPHLPDKFILDKNFTPNSFILDKNFTPNSSCKSFSKMFQ